ncbi:MAG: tetratricopeptide repeat protein [Endomicrobium sp.]|jgi:tetratricopeptide (TPR) repeat protein|nr:tetratricopeptide repeat protein [Endomicrobium sp.]
MSKKKTDKNLLFSIIFTFCFILAGAGVYVYKNSGYSKEVILQKANTYYINEQYFMAAKYYAKAVELKADGAEMHRNYAIALTKLSNYDSAVKNLKISSEIDPYNADTYYYLGNALYLKAQSANSSDKFLQAAEYLEKAATLSPETEKAYLLIGLCYRSVGMQENARAWYRRALLSGNFSQSGFYNLIGHTFREEERYKEAAGYYKRAIESDMGFVAAYCNLGDMYLKMNDANGALANYEKAIDINPEYISAYLKIGSVYAGQDNYDEAIPFYLRALQINPDNDKANYLLAMAYKSIGRNGEAVEYLKTAAYRGSDEAIYELRNIGIDLR